MSSRALVPAALTALLLAGLILTGFGLYRTLVATEPPAGEAAFEGVYQYAFETSAFFPRAEACKPDTWATAYWLGAEADAGFFERLQTLVQQAPPRWRYLDGAIVQVRFVGTLSPPGEYGHLGHYPREVIVTKLLDMSFPAACQ